MTIFVMEHSQTYTTVEYNFYITPTEESFREIKFNWLQLPRLETHRTSRVNVGVTCNALDEVLHVI